MAVAHMCLAWLSSTLASCTESTSTATVNEWLGSQRHGAIRGEADGVQVDAIAGASAVGCKREYVVPVPEDTKTYDEGWLEEYEISFYVTIDGVRQRYELQIYNFTKPAIGRSLTIVPDEIGDDPIGEDEVHAQFQWEWEMEGSRRVTYEGVAVEGTVEFRELSGEVGSDGLVIPAGEGSLGALVQLVLPDGQVGISFTAPCSIVEIDPID